MNNSKWVCNYPHRKVLESFKRHYKGLQESIKSIRRSMDWQERQRKGRTLPVSLGAASKAGGASLRKRVPLLGHAPSELTHLAGKRDSFQHLPLPCCTHHLCTGSSPRTAPFRGDGRDRASSHRQWAGLVSLGAGQGGNKNCFCAAVLGRQGSDCDLIFSLGSPIFFYRTCRKTGAISAGWSNGKDH